MREVIGRRVFWRDRYLLCFGSGRNIRLDGGLEIDNSDMIVGGKVNAVVEDAGLFCLLRYLVLCNRSITLHFRFFRHYNKRVNVMQLFITNYHD